MFNFSLYLCSVQYLVYDCKGTARIGILKVFFPNL